MTVVLVPILCISVYKSASSSCFIRFVLNLSLKCTLQSVLGMKAFCLYALLPKIVGFMESDFCSFLFGDDVRINKIYSVAPNFG